MDLDKTTGGFVAAGLAFIAWLVRNWQRAEAAAEAGAAGGIDTRPQRPILINGDLHEVRGAIQALYAIIEADNTKHLVALRALERRLVELEQNSADGNREHSRLDRRIDEAFGEIRSRRFPRGIINREDERRSSPEDQADDKESR